MEDAYDFIVVGAGASGTVLASRLAHAPASPSVLLIEAGGSNENAAHQSGADRYNAAFADGSPMNWNYKTAPQTHLAGQEIDYSRGKGLGGSTAINFCGWTVGPRDDYDEWSRIVNNSRFGWNNIERVLKKISNLDHRIPDPRLQNVINPNINDHGTQGPLALTYGDTWLPDVGDIFTAAAQIGHRVNPDVNSGDPIGMGMGSVCIANNMRGTSASAYLSHPPANLKIVVNAPVARVLFDGKRAVGVETIDGQRFTARKEVTLSAGALNTPHILKLSGIGPAAELSTHGIPLLLDAPLVGANLQDHCFASVGIVMRKDETVGLESQSPTPMGWFKLPCVEASREFRELGERTKRHIQRPTVPVIEIATHTPPSFLPSPLLPSESYLGAICLLMNPQSRGTVLLRSASPSDAPLIDPNFLSHPFDRRVLVAGIRGTIRLLSAPIFSSRTLRPLGPSASSTDEEILSHVKSDLKSSWHMSCTASMGRGSSDGVVDSAFRVFGTQGLRVVDLSVCPFVINAHTQSVGYVVGELGGEVLGEEYGLSEVRGRGKL